MIRNQWVVDHDATLVSTAGHLHPGGLWTDLNLTRDGKTVRIFRSRANYFEPAGAVSWDVAMSATAPNWRVAIKKGDVLSTNATYDTSKASWYEVMGIMVVRITDGPSAGSTRSPGTIDQTDYLTHGRLKENIDRNRAQEEPGAQQPDPRAPAARTRTRSSSSNFVYSQGDLSCPGKAACRRGAPGPVAEVRQRGRAADRALPHDHRVQGAVQPDGGIGYPLANGPTASTRASSATARRSARASTPAGTPARSDHRGRRHPDAPKANCKRVPRGWWRSSPTAASARRSWKTPKNLSAGHLHVLLPDPPVHARCVPGREEDQGQDPAHEGQGLAPGGLHGAPPPRGAVAAREAAPSG